MERTAEKLASLKKLLSSYGGAVIAYSGGVDSTFLARVAHAVLGERVLAVTASSATYPQHEIEDAASLAQQLGLPHLVIHTEELADDKFTSNPPRRCYYCKKELFNSLQHLAQKHGLPQVLDGSNFDDRLDFRPGMEAAQELSIKSPLLEAGLTKEDIRTLSREMGLPNWNKPAQPCLASRLPYGETITGEKLSMVEEAEAVLRALGLDTLRVRHHGNLARIEVEPGAFPLVMKNALEISNKLREVGYSYVTLDLQGFRSGSLNETF